ncbi:MAG: dimethyl sulfoxide reductase anchor subunit [Planctomycetales bacterium]|nr:dimethyl sulfoxide reductase anchor subunit [Planctomycetales bacterium]
MSLATSADNLTSDNFLRSLLREQADLSAVQRFSVWHDLEDISRITGSLKRDYRSLLPTSAPTADEQYAFHVDLDVCSGCKACVVACHTLNGLEEEESWRRVGILTMSETPSQQRYVTMSCHHCADPACLNGCPVLAYDKDIDTGIVRHLDDQCIGCKYCTMMCPYQVPQYSQRLGIVRKCDMCSQRLRVGEAPACVQACPNEAISIRLASRDQVAAKHAQLVPTAPESTITQPTTQYVSALIFSQTTTAQDKNLDHAEEPHWPLAAMLVLTQASIGLLIVSCLSEGMRSAMQSSNFVTGPATEQIWWNSSIALLVAILGLAVAPLHLGQPLRAWRVFLGLRRSWLSREAVLLGCFVAILAGAIGVHWFDRIYPSNNPLMSWPMRIEDGLLMLALIFGLAGVFSSGMIYVATRRELWDLEKTMVRFCGTAMLTGLVIASSLTAQVWLGAGAGIVLICKLLWEWADYLGGCRKTDSDLQKRSRRLIERELALSRIVRLVLGFGGLSLIILGMSLIWAVKPVWGSAVMGVAAVITLGGEFLERTLYFSGVVFDRMPGAMK